jgi:hypothetical protein
MQSRPHLIVLLCSAGPGWSIIIELFLGRTVPLCVVEFSANLSAWWLGVVSMLVRPWIIPFPSAYDTGVQIIFNG